MVENIANEICRERILFLFYLTELAAPMSRRLSRTELYAQTEKQMHRPFAVAAILGYNPAS